MKKHIILFLVISFIVVNCATYEKGEGISLEPGQKPGAKVIIQKKNRQQVKGELIAVKENSLLLKESATGVDVSVEVKDVNLIIIKKKSVAKLTMSIGFAVGCLATIPSAIKYVDEMKKEGRWWPEYGYARPLAWGALGALIGLLVALPSSLTEYVHMRDKSEEEVEEILVMLRKKARVPDFQ